MSLNTTALSAYTNENAMDLIKESVLKGRTIDLVTVQGGIKSSATINRLSSTLAGQAGACGWNANSSTTLDQRTIAVKDIKINEEICLNDLEDYYTQVMMNPGSYNTEIPFEQLFAENKRDQVMSMIEEIVWKGDVAGGSGNLALADGFVTLFDAEITSGDSNYGTYTIADWGNDAIDVVDAMIAQLDENIIDAEDLTLFMSYPMYRQYAKALRDANLFHYTGAENQGLDFSQIHPGTNVRVVATKGLSSTDRLLLVPASSLYIGTDLMSDAEDFRIFYSADFDVVKFLAKFKLGVQISFVEHAVWYVGA